jgi:hypothetical protein
MDVHEELDDARPDWLRNLAEKTWNLELVISGAAIFMATYLPGTIDQGLSYYLDLFSK